MVVALLTKLTLLVNTLARKLWSRATPQFPFPPTLATCLLAIFARGRTGSGSRSQHPISKHPNPAMQFNPNMRSSHPGPMFITDPLFCR